MVYLPLPLILSNSLCLWHQAGDWITPHRRVADILYVDCMLTIYCANFYLNNYWWVHVTTYIRVAFESESESDWDSVTTWSHSSWMSALQLNAQRSLRETGIGKGPRWNQTKFKAVPLPNTEASSYMKPDHGPIKPWRCPSTARIIAPTSPDSCPMGYKTQSMPSVFLHQISRLQQFFTSLPRHYYLFTF